MDGRLDGGPLGRMEKNGAEDGAQIPFINQNVASEKVEKVLLGGNFPRVGDVFAGEKAHSVNHLIEAAGKDAGGDGIAIV